MALGVIPVKGALDMTANRGTNAANGVNPQDFATVSQVSASLDGQGWKNSVRAATVVAGTLATSFEAGDTIDGVVLVALDRILVKDQVSAIENGLYIVQASGAPVRAADFAAATPGTSASLVAVEEGSVNADLVFIVTTDGNPVPGTDANNWAFVTPAGAAILAGQSGGQTLIGGTASGEDLTLQSTANATKGSIILGTSAYDEVNNRFGIRTVTPSYMLDMGVNTFVAIDGLFGHIIQHNNASTQFWGLATRNSGDYALATSTSNPRPSGGVISSSGDVVRFTAAGLVSTVMGTSGSFSGVSGKANVNTTTVGTDANTVEKDLMTYSLPANSLNADGRLVRVTAWGTTAANGNEKTIKLYFGSTVVRQLGSAAFNNQDWIAEAIVVRTGASAQDSIGREMTNNNNVFLTHSEPAEDTTAATTIRVTGQNGTAAANDIVAEGMLVEYLN